jgi:hypothetical protein
MIDIFILLTFSSVFFFLVFENLRLKNKHIATLSELLKSKMDNNIKDGLIKDGPLLNPLKKNDEDETKEHFIKFLSDSRDAAFLYIEDVQKGIYDYINTVEPYIFNLESDILSKELEKIKKLIPDDYGTMDK